MGATQDMELAKATLEFIGTKARDQDVMYFFTGLGSNFKMRRSLTEYFQQNYETIYKRFEGNFSVSYLITFSSDYYSRMEDYEAIETFYREKDTSKYKLALAQALDGIRARAEYVEVSVATSNLAGSELFLQRSKNDLLEWLDSRK